MADKDTLFDTIINKIKNNKLIALIMVVAVVIAAILAFLSTVLKDGGTITDILFPQKEKVQIVITVKPYDLISESNQTQSLSRQFFTLEGDVDIANVSNSTVGKILAIIQPRSKPEIDLEIIKDRLHAFEPVVASISLFQSPIQTLAIKEFGFGENVDLNLEEFFIQDSGFYDPTCNCISLYIEDAAGQLQPKYIQIFKNEQSFSFESESVVIKKSIKSEISQTRILIVPFNISGTNSETGAQVQSLLDINLRQELAKYDFIMISTLSLEDLQSKREELKNLPPSGGKPEIVEQYNVDFIVSGEIIVTNEP